MMRYACRSLHLCEHTLTQQKNYEYLLAKALNILQPEEIFLAETLPELRPSGSCGFWRKGNPRDGKAEQEVARLPLAFGVLAHPAHAL